MKTTRKSDSQIMRPLHNP